MVKIEKESIEMDKKQYGKDYYQQHIKDRKQYGRDYSKTYYQQHKKDKKKYNEDYYQKYKINKRISLTSTKIKPYMTPILYAPDSVDYLSNAAKNKILGLVESENFIYKRFTIGDHKIIWVIKRSENGCRFILKNKTDSRPEEHKTINDVIGVFKCFNYTKEEVAKTIEEEKDKLVPFISTYLELLSACNFFEIYGVYYCEF